MIDIAEEEFEKIVSKAIDAIPEKYYQKVQNVVFVVEDQPSPEQREKLELHCNQTLYGLYEGIPLTKRGAGYNLVIPDKITIFRLPMLFNSNTLVEVQKSVHKTVWHEVAHYFGLDHDRIHALE
jgi:predicted Zn-dependent protease with MMP-like domain